MAGPHRDSNLCPTWYDGCNCGIVMRVQDRLAELAGWQRFPYASIDDEGFRFDWCPPGERVHISTIKPLPSLDHLLIAVSESLSTAQATIAEKEAELKSAKSEHSDFLSFMAVELAGWPCQCENGEHASTPPYCWPELIACIVKKAVKSALQERVNEETKSAGCSDTSDHSADVQEDKT